MGMAAWGRGARRLFHTSHREAHGRAVAAGAPRSTSREHAGRTWLRSSSSSAAGSPAPPPPLPPPPLLLAPPPLELVPAPAEAAASRSSRVRSRITASSSRSMKYALMRDRSCDRARGVPSGGAQGS